GDLVAYLEGGLSLMRPDGSGARLVAAGGGGDADEVDLPPPSWSPDGRRIAFERGDDIAVYDLARRRVLNVTRTPGSRLETGPEVIVTGPVRSLWFAESNGGKIGRLLFSSAAGLVLPSQPVPASITAGRGATVVWTFAAPNIHSATDASRLGLFDSNWHSPVS